MANRNDASVEREERLFSAAVAVDWASSAVGFLMVEGDAPAVATSGVFLLLVLPWALLRAFRRGAAWPAWALVALAVAALPYQVEAGGRRLIVAALLVATMGLAVSVLRSRPRRRRSETVR